MYVYMYVCMHTEDGIHKAHEIQRAQHLRLDLLLREIVKINVCMYVCKQHEYKNFFTLFSKELSFYY